MLYKQYKKVLKNIIKEAICFLSTKYFFSPLDFCTLVVYNWSRGDIIWWKGKQVSN